MAEMVIDSGVTTHEYDNSWRYAEQPGGQVSVTIVPALFVPDDEGKRAKYITGEGENATTVWIRSGTPLAKITSGANNGLYGPYDSTASDGRQNIIAGLLESDVELQVTLSGVRAEQPNVGMRYRGDIIVSNLHADVSGAKWGGDFYDIEDDVVTPLSNAGSAAAPVTVDTLSGATDIGKQLMKAASAEAARTAINAAENAA